MEHIKKLIQKCYLLRDISVFIGTWLSDLSSLTYLLILSVKGTITLYSLLDMRIITRLLQRNWSLKTTLKFKQKWLYTRDEPWWEVHLNRNTLWKVSEKSDLGPCRPVPLCTAGPHPSDRTHAKKKKGSLNQCPLTSAFLHRSLPNVTCLQTIE